MGKKQKERQRQRRQQAKLERRRIKRANITHRLPGIKPGASLPGLDAFSDRDHLFWVAHGLNFIASDHEHGLWRPLFPEIYEGLLPAEEELAQRVMVHYQRDLDSERPTTGKVATAWAIQDKATVFTFREQARANLREAQPDLDDEALTEAVQKPHATAPWAIFNDMKAAVLRDMAS